MRELHAAIARAAEHSAWLAAAKHYALAGQEDDAMRVLGSAAGEALGTGSWGAAVAVISLMPNASPPPAVEVIKARALTAAGDPADAIALLGAIDNNSMDTDERTLVALARASALQAAGNSEAYASVVNSMSGMSHSHRVVARLTSTWSLMGIAAQGGSLSDAGRSLGRLSRDATRAGLTHFAGIALHNAATVALAQAEYSKAVQLAIEAGATLATSKVDEGVRPSALAVQASALAELGRISEAVALSEQAVLMVGAHPDVYADAAVLATISGDPERAQSLEHRLRRAVRSGSTQVGVRHLARVTKVIRLACTGDVDGALAEARTLDGDARDELDGVSRARYLLALTSALVRTDEALDLTRAAILVAESQQAWRWDFRLRMLEAVLRADGRDFARWVADCAEMSPLAILELADVIGGSLHLFDQIPEGIAHSVAHYPHRWRPVLRRQLLAGGTSSAAAAAQLLSEFGVHEDAEPLARYEHSLRASGRRVRLSQALVRRVSPTLRVHDLGRTTYDVAGQEARASAARRKALGLVLYLVTRPKQTSSREQLMEELWPNQTPAGALNSLHQTLHFVRRDIAPWREGGATADYVALDSEIVYLDPELVQVDSVAFMRQASEALASRNPTDVGASITRLYTGRFAPEFEYEDWAEDWRTLLHAQFLRLSQVAATGLFRAGRYQDAIEVLMRAVEIDPMALDLRASLIRALVRDGSVDAATDHYRQYVRLSKRELGIRAPTLEELLDEGRDEEQPP
jgi:DNA-binding SARP family transcriptional activator